MRKIQLTAVAILVSLCTGACSLEFASPVTVENRPLAEQIAERASAEELEDASSIPEAIAFDDTWASGTFLRLDIASGGGVALRSGPGDTYEEIATVSHGSEVLATGNQTGEWIHVLYAAFDGWIPNDRVTLGSVASSDQLVDAVSVERQDIVYEVYGETIGVNVRSAPSVDGDLVTGAPVGSLVLATGRAEGSWLEVSFQGTTGWASGNYLRPVELSSLTDAERESLGLGAD